MLLSFKVEKIVVSAISDLVETWTEGFGFKLVEESEKLSLNRSTWWFFPEQFCSRKLYDSGKAQEQSGEQFFSSFYLPVGLYLLFSLVLCALKFNLTTIFSGDELSLRVNQSTKIDENDCYNEAVAKLESKLLEIQTSSIFLYFLLLSKGCIEIKFNINIFNEIFFI